MPKLPKIVKMIRGHPKSLSALSTETWVSKSSLHSLKTMKSRKYRKQTLDTLYNYFELGRDDFYDSNLKSRYPPTFSVIGNILRKKRISLWYSISEVAQITKWEKRQIFRIEAWDSLPAYSSRYMTQLMDLYKFDEEERNKIMRGIAILKDLVKINNRYDDVEEDLGRDDPAPKKWHWKKTVVRI